MNPLHEHRLALTRRHFFRQGGMGLGAAALGHLLGQDAMAAAPGMKAAAGLPHLPHFAPKAKRAIYLFMSGAPSQLDMFDYKPKMADLFDEDLPESIRQGQRLTTMTSKQKRFPVAPSMYAFEKVANNADGAWISELLPYTKKMAKDLCIIKSMHTEAINHDPAITYFCTGDQLPGKASLGAWLSYGLGSENENLPAFVVMNATWSAKRDAQAIYNRLWGSGFLPSKHQGVLLRSQGDPVLFLSNPEGVERNTRRRMLDALEKLNRKTLESFGDPETQARIAQYEMAFRMQASVPELTDLSQEPERTFEAYGPDSRKPGTFANCALMARRLAERGVRFTQIFHRGWDQHGNIAGDLPLQCRDVDQAAHALITDLRERGMLEDTLVVWGGEFGRTIYCQGKLTRENYGRDHHPRNFTIWMAGAGVKPGIVYGETDDFSYNVTENPVHIHSFNATLLHLLGINHRQFTFKHQGLDQRLTGVESAPVVKDILL
ncbi:MAG: DUF1501 domain-containing protein [Akkermansiaceae bacterium]|nr:DUF1501 domain-containing protein [Akkermansiaceae bacterium]